MAKAQKRKIVKQKNNVVILGAGITGLVTAYYLSDNYNVTVIEKEKFTGGTARGFDYKEFTLDYGPHKLYTELPGIMDEIANICPLIKIKKKNSIFIKGNYYDFPLKITQVLKKMPFTAISAGIDIFTKPFMKRPDDSYENYLTNRFGKTLYDLSFRDYAWKVWGSDPKELDQELAKRRVAVSGVMALIKGVLFKDTKQISAEYFYYPEKGMKQLFDILAEKIKENNGKIILSTEISEIKIKKNKIESIKYGKTKIIPDYIISTIPLDSLQSVIKPANEELRFNQLQYRKLNIIYFVLSREKALNDCWIFFPEKKLIFQRVSEQKAFSPMTSPKDKTIIMVETTREANNALIGEIIRQLEAVSALKRSDIIEYFVKSIDKAYPVYKKGFMESLNPSIAYLDSIENFYTLGRQGLFNYNNMDQCWDMAMKLADQIKYKKTKADWQKTKEYFDSYRIVD